MAYLTQWQFWLAVIAVAFVTHFVMNMIGGGKSS
jgi:hypothetical protein